MLHKVMKFNLSKICFMQNTYQTCCYCARFNIKNDIVTFFQQNLGLPENEVQRIFKKYPSFYNDTYSTLSDNFSLLMSFGFSKDDILKKIQILTLHSITIKNYAMLLEEGGFVKNKIDSKAILRFKFISKKSIQSLKNENFIQKHIDVGHHILSYIQFPIELYPKNCDESLSWNQVQKNIFKLYVGWKIKMDVENIKYAQTIYHRLYNKSYRLMDRSIDILLKELNFTEEKIRRHSYLIHSDPDNTQAILNNFKNLCGMDVKFILSKHPKIILTPWKTIRQIKKHFEDFGIPESSLAKAPEIYTLGSNTIYERLCKLKETPELASFINNPQVARLIYYYTKVNTRLTYLKSKNCVSLNLLVTNNFSFNRFNCNGNDKGKTNDIMIYLTKELGEDKKKLRTLLERHPYWQYISLLTIRKTYEFLKINHFTKDQLCHCSQILLYPVDKIKDTLVSTQNMKNVSYLRDVSGSIKSEYLLPLVLYNLEKDYHFSGDGVWNTNEQTKKIPLSDSPKVTLEDTEELDHEPSTQLLG
ncbi:transcription termination factor 5, mitochondrial isoform X1 [Myzus persicae]|uniref:transcription termination factor 5, mitochondrial isoform X1 n=2 Tax=Myzus persicae TaxID=13164 RepID=UPI000B9311E7|nr:transcription termination factor 5, mitochondrial isoform X1 [Myzus persicae]XP_022183217.1 transcription termination factor 5, mitochondrial isoform X1 [Myzus persicae]